MFQPGDQVVLAKGTYQGTLGVFLRLTDDPNWAFITERDGRVRNHPLQWMALASASQIAADSRT